MPTLSLASIAATSQAAANAVRNEAERLAAQRTPLPRQRNKPEPELEAPPNNPETGFQMFQQEMQNLSAFNLAEFMTDAYNISGAAVIDGMMQGGVAGAGTTRQR